MTVKIVTDSCSDLSPEQAHELGISIIPLYVRIGQESFRDGVDITQDQFYEKLTSSSELPATSQPTPDDFARVYKELSKETDEIVSIHISGKLSGTCNSALQGREMANSKSNITVVDSEAVTMGLGIIALSAARIAQKGEALRHVLEETRQAIEETHMFGTFDTLKYLLLGGRIGKVKALLGSVLNVKPVITCREGELAPIGNVRTRAKGVEKLFEAAKNALHIQELAVVHSTTPDEAHSLKERLMSLVDSDRLHLARLGPALGVHGGPGTLAVAFRKKSILPDLPKPSLKKISVPSLHLPKINLPRR
jgi:DegV family protein with EDD domain